jgi:hypothetical protein
MSDNDDVQRLPGLDLGLGLRKRRRMYTVYAQNRARVLRDLGLAVDFEKVDTAENGDARCRVTVTEQESGRVALAFLVYGEEWGFLLADRLAMLLAGAGIEALWYPGEEPRWGPEPEED